MEQLQFQKAIEEFQQLFISNSLRYYTEADIHVVFFRILEKELSSRNLLLFDGDKQSVLHREYPTFNRLLKEKGLYVPQREINKNKNLRKRLKKQRRGHFDIAIWDPDQSWMLNELRDKSSYQNPKKCYFKEVNNNMVPYNPVKYAFELKFNRLGTELFRELYNDFYKLSLRNGRDNEEDIKEGYLIYTIRKSPIETSKFTRESYQWSTHFLSDETYFLSKLRDISIGKNMNLYLKTNFTLDAQIKSSGTKTESKNRALADEIVKKMQMVGEDSMEDNPQKRINIVVIVSTTDD
ncbi:MAG: hypothetical protein ACXQTW_03595 [Candidatus Methanospirareceae archaeon]